MTADIRDRLRQLTAAHAAATPGPWRLDAAGVLPREQRPAVTPGRPVPRRPAGMGPAPARTPLPPLPPAPAPRQPTSAQRAHYCTREGCHGVAKGRGLCAKHYMAERRAAS